jgi:hypothetical protein
LIAILLHMSFLALGESKTERGANDPGVERNALGFAE